METSALHHDLDSIIGNASNVPSDPIDLILTTIIAGGVILLLWDSFSS